MIKYATISLAAVLALPAIGCAQDRGDSSRNAAAQTVAEQGVPAQREKARRLETVTWNSVTHELTWTVSTGEELNGRGYTPKMQDSYVINLDAATMTYNGESRRFSREEAANVQMIMDLISKYAVDSTLWWQQGHGVRLDKDGNPVGGGNEGEGTEGPSRLKRVAAPERPASNAQMRSAMAALQSELERLSRVQTVSR
ncbi:MAG: hypothetical protein ACM3ZB_03230 [bacterium]|jgi:hypothetical protein